MDNMKFDLSKLLEISARTAFAVACACALLLFFPSNWLPFDITELRDKYGLWMFVILVVSISIMFSYLLKWVCAVLKNKYEIHKTWSNYRAVFECLSDKEKLFLKDKYEKNENTLMIDLTSPMHKHLQTLQILSLNVGTNLGSPRGMPGFIQPWVFEMIKKYPKCIRVDKE